MSSAEQRAELQAAIWKIANDVRGAVDGRDFKAGFNPQMQPFRPWY